MPMAPHLGHVNLSLLDALSRRILGLEAAPPSVGEGI
jgi:hypothetical protein